MSGKIPDKVKEIFQFKLPSKPLDFAIQQRQFDKSALGSSQLSTRMLCISSQFQLIQIVSDLIQFHFIWPFVSFGD